MGNLLTASKRTAELLVPIYDVLATCGIKREEAEYFCSPKCLIIMHLLADLEPLFMGKFLKRLDSDDAVIIDVFAESARMMEQLNDVSTPLLNAFLDGLYEDQNGNVCINNMNGDDILLNYTHRPSPVNVSKLDKIKENASDLKQKVLENIKSNIESQSQDSTIVEYTSCFDLSRQDIGLEERIELLKKLYSIYGEDYWHSVTDENALGLLAADKWCVQIKYPAKLDCTSEQIVKQFQNLWHVLNKEWIKKKKGTSTRKFWSDIIKQHGYMCTDLLKLVQILCSISPGTGPLERSYSRLARICRKDRNWLKTTSMEVLWLLSIFRLKDDLFDQARVEMSK